MSPLHDIDKVERVEYDVLKVPNGFYVDVWILLGNGLEALEQVLERCSNTLDDMVSEHHMVAPACIERLVVKSLLFIAMMMSLGYPVGNWADHVTVTTVFHPRV
jgi:hypothetical protein